jgi:hypothetical protein
MVIKAKTEQLLVKQLKTCEKKMQELTDSIKRPNLRSMGIEEVIIYIQQNSNSKFSKSREIYAHIGAGSLQNTKQT